MKILGINQVPSMIAWQHDSAAALVVDGKIIASAEEERFNRIRHSRGYPKKAVEYCLEA
jgi:carbamoyltransferase